MQAANAALTHARRDLRRIAPRHDIAVVARIVARERQRFGQIERLLRSYSYEAVLERGFALVLDAAGAPVKSPAQVAVGDTLAVRVAEGDFGVAVTGPSARPRRATSRRNRTPDEQGSLL
jgi:exodeoxyribonuclease VII large subunit